MNEIKKKLIIYILLIVFLIAFVISAAMIILEIYNTNAAKTEFEQLEQLISIHEPETENETQQNTSANDTQPDNNEVKPLKIERDVSKLISQNNDCVGWLSIPETNINYPVMHTPSEPEKYLRKSFFGKYRRMGTPFIDYRCSLESDNLIIYGHNMLNGTMFSSLEKYLNESYLNSHKTIEFETVEGCQYYTVQTVKVVEDNDSWYSVIDTEDETKYLTLSTCYGENQKQRLLIIATKN